MKKHRDRIYWRDRSGTPRAWGDFRDYAAEQGRQEPLKAPGEKMATTDPDVARDLCAARLRELDGVRRGRALHGKAGPPLGEYVDSHISKKRRSGKSTSDWIDLSKLYLGRAVEYLGARRELTTITVRDIQTWIEYLSVTKYSPHGAKPDAEGRSLSNGTIRHHLNCLSNLFDHAESEGMVPVGYNPVSKTRDKPVADEIEAQWLEVPQAALLLECARTLPPAKPSQLKDALPPELAHALLATFLLTGGRHAEVAGLEVDDVSFARETVVFRKHSHRRLKTKGSFRVVPLHPQLAEILKPYADRRSIEKGGRLLFPSPVTGGVIKDWRKTLDRIAARAGWKAGEIRTKRFRHTYAAARLQCTDHGAPISPYTVSRELGHSTTETTETIYAHLGTFRVRSEHVEYRVDQHPQLADQLANLLA